MKRLFGEIWLLICTCVPGCGQMQQGYMKRGISQTIAFCAILAMAIFLETGALACFLAPLWAYSFFDAYNLRRLAREGMPQEDAYLFGLSDMDSKRLTELLEKRHSFIGWVLVAMGLLILWQNIARWLYDMLNSLFEDFGSWWLYDNLVHGVPRMAVTLAIIALGVWFIRGPKLGTEEPEFTPSEGFAEEDTPFTAKGPYSQELHMPLQLTPEQTEDPAEQGEEEEDDDSN